MIEPMRLVLITLTVLGCGSKDDYPPVPQPLVWHDIPLVPQRARSREPATGSRFHVAR